MLYAHHEGGARFGSLPPTGRHCASKNFVAFDIVWRQTNLSRGITGLAEIRSKKQQARDAKC
jgi:hypothetical protein